MRLNQMIIARFSCLMAAGGLLIACAAITATPQTEGDLATATPADGLREALRVGTSRAVESLGRVDGYLANVDVRIPVPPKLDKLAKGLRAIGAGFIVDDFVTGMNRAAEAAAPAAKEIFFDAVGEMSFPDALTILRGHAHEATDYLEEHSRARLAGLFRPIVAEKLDSAGATHAFEALMRETEKLPFMDRPVFDLEHFVTEAALDGLFFTVAREEEKIRQDPVARTTALLKRFFGHGI
jgi:hypothetical protein